MLIIDLERNIDYWLRKKAPFNWINSFFFFFFFMKDAALIKFMQTRPNLFILIQF